MWEIKVSHTEEGIQYVGIIESDEGYDTEDEAIKAARKYAKQHELPMFDEGIVQEPY